MTTIVVVDDSPMILRMLSMALEQAGYDVATAEDGDEGLARIKEHEPPLVLLDAMMPKRDGYQVCAALRGDASLARQPHVIMLTASGQEADRERAEQAGVNEFMTKPFSPSQLLERVEVVLRATS